MKGVKKNPFQCPKQMVVEKDVLFKHPDGFHVVLKEGEKFLIQKFDKQMEMFGFKVDGITLWVEWQDVYKFAKTVRKY